MHRQAHVLKSANGKRLPQRFIFFDCETETIDDKGTQRLKLIVACLWVIRPDTGIESLTWRTYKTGKGFYRWIKKNVITQHATRIMSANVWFDFRVSGLYTLMKADKWSCVSSFNKGHVLIFKFIKGNHRIEFVNVQNYFNVPVKVIGDSFNLPKLDVDFKKVSDEDLYTYCRRDVEIIYTAIRKLYLFILQNRLGSMPYTLPAIAYSVFTYRFMDKQISVHDDADILQLERSSYFGGRCECFKIGKLKRGKYYKLDINSMYPYVMKENSYPLKHIKTGININPKVLLKAANKYCYVAECEIETNIPVYAYRKDKKLIFPIGRFTTYLTTPSLLYGIEHGHIKKVLKVACYTKANIFHDFVEYFYNKRLEFRADKNPAFAYVCKLILNSLYGKFGQRTSKVVYTGKNGKVKDTRRLIIDIKTHKTSIHQVFFGRETITAQGENEAVNSMPAISAHVTDYARLYLWKLIDAADIKNCYYCDTDSIIVNQSGMEKLIPFCNLDRLGWLKIEKESDKVEIRGAKNYTFGADIKIKGIPRKATVNKSGSFTYPVFPSMVGELRKGIKEDYRIETQTKILTGIYDKGIVTKSGRVKPYRLKAATPGYRQLKLVTD